MIHYENSGLTDDEFVLVKGLPKKSRHACFCIRIGHHCGLKIPNDLQIPRWHFLNEPIGSFKFSIFMYSDNPSCIIFSLCSSFIMHIVLSTAINVDARSFKS